MEESLTGQSLPVKSDNTDIAGPESLRNNEKLSSVSGSTPAYRNRLNAPADVHYGLA